nr:hypothetical protein [Pseudomonas sp. PDM20]
MVRHFFIFISINNMRRELFVFLLIVLVTTIWGGVIGKDLSWDVMNHHFYIPYAWWNGRVFEDLFAAGPQSYQSPLGYFPFYFMVVSGWPSWMIGAGLGVLHAVNIVLIYRIASNVWSGNRSQLLWSVLAAALAGASPVFLALVSSSSVDILSSIFVLAALSLVVGSRSRDVRGGWCFVFAGAFLALAVSIKLSNLIFVIALGGVMLVQLLQRRLGWLDAFIFSLGFLAALSLGMSWYCWELYRNFQSPIFPLYNSIFKSPYASVEDVVSSRFGLGVNIFYRSFQMAEMKRFVYFEGFAPDVRYAALLVAFGAVFIKWGCVRRRSRERLEMSGLDCDLLVFYALSFCVWIFISGNARYVLPVCLLAGLLLVRYIFLLCGQRVGRLLALLVICFQAAYSLSASDLRFVFEPWDSKPFYKTEAQEELIETPYLHLLLGIKTNASLLASAGVKGVFVNPLGQSSIPESGALGERFRSLRSEWRGRTRAFLPDFLGGSPANVETTRVQINKMLYRLGYEVDLRDCLKFEFYREKPESGSVTEFVQRKNMYQGGSLRSSYISCRLNERETTDADFERSRQRADQVFKVIEAACPQLYGPSGGVTEWGNGAWERFYANTDTSVMVSEERGVMARLLRSPVDKWIGTFAEVEEGKGTFDCTRPSMLTPD